MLLRLAAAIMLAGPFGLAQAALAREPTKVPAKSPLPAATTPSPKPAAPSGKPAAHPTDKDPGASPAKQRQKACSAEWRGFTAAEKTAQGPKWPQFYSRCVKRLKAKAG